MFRRKTLVLQTQRVSGRITISLFPLAFYPHILRLLHLCGRNRTLIVTKQTTPQSSQITTDPSLSQHISLRFIHLSKNNYKRAFRWKQRICAHIYGFHVFLLTSVYNFTILKIQCCFRAEILLLTRILIISNGVNP